MVNCKDILCIIIKYWTYDVACFTARVYYSSRYLNIVLCMVFDIVF